MKINLSILLITILLCFVAAEFSFRYSRAGERLAWQLVPSAHDRLNAYAKAPKMSGEIFLLGLGDSFTEFQDTLGRNFLRYAEGTINAEDHKITVFNLGESGTGAPRYFNNFCAALKTRKPNIVIFGLYFGNDVRGYSKIREVPSCEIKPENNQHVIVSTLKKSLLINAIFRLSKAYIPQLRSNFYKDVRAYARSYAGLSDEELRTAEERIDPELMAAAKSDAINPWDVVTAITEPNFYVDLSSQPDDKFREDIEALVANFSQVNDQCRASNINCLVVVFPVAPWATPENHDYFIRLGHQVSGLENTDPISLRYFISRMDENSIPVLDLLPVLRDHRNLNLYIEWDTHLTAQGQAVAGKALVDYISSRGWVSPE